jgi:hypothetical protein
MILIGLVPAPAVLLISKLMSHNLEPACGFPIFALLGILFPAAVTLAPWSHALTNFTKAFPTEIAVASRLATVFRATMVLHLHKQPDMDDLRQFLMSLNVHTGALAVFTSAVLNPVQLGPGIASQLGTLVLTASSDVSICEGALAAPSAVRHLERLHKYLPPIMWLPYMSGVSYEPYEEGSGSEGASGGHFFWRLQRYSCPAIAVQWQVLAFLGSAAVGIVTEVVHRRSFLRTTEPMLGRREFLRAKKWPFDGCAGWQMCTSVAHCFLYGGILLREAALSCFI